MKHTAPISGIAAFKDQYVATSGYDNRVILWNTSDFSAISQSWHDHLVNTCAFSPCGNYLVTASSDYSIRVWSVPSLRLLRVINEHSDDVMKADFSPDGSMIASSGYDGKLFVFTKDGHRIASMDCGANVLVESFDWSKDSKQVISVGTDSKASTWDALTGELLACEDYDGVDVDAVAFISGGARITGDNNGYLKLVSSESEISLKAHDSAIKNIAVSPSEASLVTTSYDGFIKHWRIEKDLNLQLLHASLLPNIAWPRSLAFTSEDNVVIATFGSTFLSLPLADYKWKNINVTPSVSINSVYVENGDIYSIGDSGLLSKDGNTLGGPKSLCNFITAFSDMYVCGGQASIVFCAKSGRELAKTNSPINCSAVFTSGDKNILAIGCYSGDIFFYEADSNTLKEIKVLDVHVNAIKGLAVSNEQLFSGSADGELAIIDTNTLQINAMHKKAHECILNDCCSFDVGFATVSRDLTLALWNKEGLIKRVESRHKNSMKCVESSEDGKFIATGSYGGTIDIFSVKQNDWIGKVLRPTTAGISSIAWNKAMNQFVASSYDGNIYPISIAS